MNSLENDLKGAIRGEILADEDARALYASAACIYRIKPDIIVRPKDRADVIAAVKIAGSHQVPVTARGAGSGVTGAAIGRGIILDFSKYMHRTKSINDSSVIIEPGVVYGKLTKELLSSGRMFPPDPSSGDYCTLGGMLANNSSGARSIKYGSTRDWVEDITFVTAAGDILKTSDEDVLAAKLKSNLIEILSEHSDEIVQRKPKVSKFSSGYHVWGGPENSLRDILVGSEGTLGIILEATLKTAPVPRKRGTLLLAFPTLESAGEAVPILRELSPSAIELLDELFVKLVRDKKPDVVDFLPEEERSILIVEFEGENIEEIGEKIETSISNVSSLSSEAIKGLSGDQVDKIWSLRKAASPIIGSMKGPKRATRFVEDIVTRPENLAGFLHSFRSILKAEDALAPGFGHAGDGNIHINPLLNLRDPADVRKMKRIADEVYKLATDSGGALSGEHGDGRMRSSYLKTYFGDELYKVFRDVKKMFDPNGLLNPDVKLNGLGQITDNLKTRPAGWSDKADIGFLADPKWHEEVERCHGCGACRNACPTFEATLDEAALPRGRVALLRAWAEGNIDGTPPTTLDTKEDLAIKCIFCMRCIEECPSSIDAAGLSAYWKEETNSRKSPMNRLRDFALTRPDLVGRLMKTLPKESDPKTYMPKLVQKLFGLEFGDRPLKFSSPEKQKTSPAAGDEKIVYFPGCFAEHNDPAGTSNAFIKALEKLDITPEIVSGLCCGLPLMASGNIKEAKAKAQKLTDVLMDYVEDGYSIAVTCTSCLLSLKHDYAEYLSIPYADRLAKATKPFSDILLDLLAERSSELPGLEEPLTLAYHEPCHARILGNTRATVELLESVKGLTVIRLPDKCCGLAGSFGIKSENSGLSKDMGRQLFEAVRETGAEAVVTPCGACRMQLEAGTGLKSFHPAKILLKGLGL